MAPPASPPTDVGDLIAATRIYQLYPTLSGFSAKTIDYHGEQLHVAAVSIKQAMFFAHQSRWADSADNPLGIVEKYKRDAGAPGDHWLWCGCRIFGGLFQDKQTKTSITRTMREHLADCPA